MNIEANIGNTPINVIQPTSSSSYNWKIIIAVVGIIVLAVLGFNLFLYLAKGTDVVSYILDKIAALFKYLVQLMGQGTEKTIDLTKAGITELVGTPQEKKDLDTTLDKKKDLVGPTKPDVVANSTDATKIQSGNKKGWCYVGVDRDYRSCLKVTEDDTCTTGEIYETQKQCEQPELRYDE